MGWLTFWKCRGIRNSGACTSEQITHEHLNSILAEALGVAQMTEEIFTGQIDHIGMCEPGKLIIYKKDGGTIPCSYDLLPTEKRQAGNSDVNAAWTSEVGEQFEYMYRLFFFVFKR